MNTNSNVFLNQENIFKNSVRLSSNNNNNNKFANVNNNSSGFNNIKGSNPFQVLCSNNKNVNDNCFTNDKKEFTTFPNKTSNSQPFVNTSKIFNKLSNNAINNEIKHNITNESNIDTISNINYNSKEFNNSENLNSSIVINNLESYKSNSEITNNNNNNNNNNNSQDFTKANYMNIKNINSDHINNKFNTQQILNNKFDEEVLFDKNKDNVDKVFKTQVHDNANKPLNFNNSFNIKDDNKNFNSTKFLSKNLNMNSSKTLPVNNNALYNIKENLNIVKENPEDTNISNSLKDIIKLKQIDDKLNNIDQTNNTLINKNSKKLDIIKEEKSECNSKKGIKNNEVLLNINKDSNQIKQNEIENKVIDKSNNNSNKNKSNLLDLDKLHLLNKNSVEYAKYICSLLSNQFNRFLSISNRVIEIDYYDIYIKKIIELFNEELNILEQKIDKNISNLDEDNKVLEEQEMHLKNVINDLKEKNPDINIDNIKLSKGKENQNLNIINSKLIVYDTNIIQDIYNLYSINKNLLEVIDIKSKEINTNIWETINFLNKDCKSNNIHNIELSNKLEYIIDNINSILECKDNCRYLKQYV